MARVSQDFRTSLVFKRNSQRFALENLTSVQIPEETIETQEMPTHGQPTRYMQKVANKLISLAQATFETYADPLAPAQYQLQAAKANSETLEFWIIYGEQAAVTGKHFSGKITGQSFSAMAPDTTRMVTFTVDLTTGIDEDMTGL